MVPLSVHIKNFPAAAMTAFLLSWGMTANAQELDIPDRWTHDIHRIRPLYAADTLTIRILGDVMMHEKQISGARQKDGSYDFRTYFGFIEEEIKAADIAVANMEFTLAGEPYTGYPCFSAPDSFAHYLAECGFDIFLAANNHIFDKGTKGAERTVRMYRQLCETHGILFTGIAGNEAELKDNNPLLVRKKGMLLALLNFTYGTNMGLDSAWPKTNYAGERQKIEEAFSKAEEKEADFTIVFPHWGTEYVLNHSGGQEKTALWLAENGADYIIGAHPHVVQDFENIANVPTVYSLGNAVSNMSAANTQIGLMATIRIVRETNGNLKPLPLELKYLWCSRPGGYNGSYTVIPVKEFLDRKDEWENQGDYQKMTATYERVKKETGIND